MTTRNALHIPSSNECVAYVRMTLPMTAVNERPDLGWSVTVRPTVQLPDLDSADLVVAQRVMNPAFWPFWQAAIDHPGCAVVYETDDLLLHISPDNQLAWQAYGSPEVRDAMTRMMERADALIVASDGLAAELAGHNARIEVIPNYVDASLLVDAVPEPDESRPVTIGWAGGDSHARDVATIERPLSNILRRQRTKVALHLMGSDFRGVFNARRHRFTPWHPSVPDYLRALDFDIGLCPLEDTRFNRCKTAVKALEYAARGIPVVAANVTPYKEVVAHGGWGYLYDDETGFAGYVNELIHDPGRRFEMATNALEFARGRTQQGHVEERVEAYTRLAGAR